MDWEKGLISTIIPDSVTEIEPSGFNDKRVNLHIADGNEFKILRDGHKKFSVGEIQY